LDAAQFRSSHRNRFSSHRFTLQAKLKDFLELQLADTVKGWWMRPDGDYVRSLNKDLPGLRFQERFYEILQSENRPSAAKGVVVD